MFIAIITAIIHIIVILQDGWLSDCVRAWLQEAHSLCHPHSKYSRKTSSGPPQMHNNFSATAGRVPAIDAGCGLSTRGPWDGSEICNVWKGSWQAMPHEIRLYLNTLHHVLGMLPSALYVVFVIYLVLTAVSWYQLDKTWAEHHDEAPNRPCCPCGLSKTMFLRPYLGVLAKWRCTYHQALMISLLLNR